MLSSSKQLNLQNPTANELLKHQAYTRCRESLSSFLMFSSYGTWQRANHLDLLCEKLEAVERGDITRLIITLPPRHGKSMLASQYYPAWYLGRNPSHEIIIASYGAELAYDFSRKCREIFREFGPLVWNLNLSPDLQARNQWGIENHTGGLKAAGVGGPLTGRGGNCLSYEVQIITEAGIIEIGDLVKMNPIPRVLSYNHQTNQPEWNRVMASREAHNDRLIEIETVCGHKIRTTREHRIFVHKRGYKEAYSLMPGDRIITTEIPVKQDLSILWEAKGRKRINLQRLLSKNTGCKSNSKVFLLRERSRETSLRLQKGFETRAYRFLLQSGLFSKTPCSKERKTLCLVRFSNAWKKNFEILFKRMQNGCINCKPKTCDMSGVWKRIHSTLSFDSLLFKRLCRCSTLKENGRYRKFKFQRRNELFQIIRFDEAVNFRERWRAMCSMWNRRRHLSRQTRCSSFNTCNSSYRQRYNKEQSGEFDNDLQNLPCSSSQISYDSVAVVREICPGEIPVYDIQVEGNSNFFAGKILVHNCILIDDPVKNWEEASSKTVRDTTYEWYRSTLRTRLAPGGRIILIQTRWHQDDLAGRLIADMQAGTGEQWEVLNLPALAGEHDPLGRLPGTPLWPERFPLTELDKTRLSMGSYIWNALYQQSPGDPEGSLFKRQFFHYFTVKDDNFIISLPNDKTDIIPVKSCICFQTCDPAGSAKSSADYFVLSTWYLTPKGQLLLRDVIREQLEGPDQPDLFRQAYQRWAPAVQGVEVAGLGLTLFQYLQRSGLPVVELKPGRDKVTRALPAAARYQSGSVYHYKPAPWLDAIEEELIGFPHAAHDDFVDTLSYAVRLMVPMMQSQTVPVMYEEPYEISPV